MKKPYLEIGRIVGTHGVRGEVKIEPWADSPEFLRRFSRLFIDGKAVAVKSSYVHKSMVIAALEEYNSVNDVMPLKDKTVSIDRNDARLPKDRVFLQDILGAKVVDESGKELGILEDVLTDLHTPVYVVKGEREILIPDIPDFILDKNADEEKITVRLIEGM